ncbi:MAG: hypothetical protein O3A78_09400 [Nitrospinae bacterium]|jgi:hypothetical protein|nr:hypothetical protein [Nitrospinota bacterium]MDA1110007.1 hypothetical protein [Nitrospinota bacterium]
MDPFDSHLDKAYEKLNKAIMNAIVSSEDVRTVLADFKEKDMINNLSVLNLILSLEELSDLVFTDDDSSSYEPQSDEFASKAAEKPAKIESPNPFKVDGRNLTPNEILFERFFQGKFDADKWLKKVGLKF